MSLCNYPYFQEIISGNNCQESHVTALLHCPNHFCKMPRNSKVTKAIRRQVVHMKSGGLSLSAIGGDLGRFKSNISPMVKITLMCTRTSFNGMPYFLYEHRPINQQIVQKILLRVTQPSVSRSFSTMKELRILNGKPRVQT